MGIVCVETVQQLDAVRELFLAYYHIILAQYGIDLVRACVQAEIDPLPGSYAPPTGMRSVPPVRSYYCQTI